MTGDSDVLRHGKPEIFLATSQRAPLLALLRGLETGEPLIIITGDSGVGKTTLLASVVPPGDVNGTHTVWCKSAAGEPITLARLIREVGGRIPDIDIADDLAERQFIQSDRTILVIDDAHLLTPEAITYLIIVLNFVETWSGRLQLILVGRPALRSLLHSVDVLDRVRSSGEVTGLPPSEAREYLRVRLESLGAPVDEVLTGDAARALGEHDCWTPVELNEIIGKAVDGSGGRGEGSIAGAIAQRTATPPGEVAAAAYPRSGWRAPCATMASLAILVSGHIYWSLIPTDAARPVAVAASARPVPRPGASAEMLARPSPAPPSPARPSRIAALSGAQQPVRGVAPAAGSSKPDASVAARDKVASIPNEIAKTAASADAPARHAPAAVEALIAPHPVAPAAGLPDDRDETGQRSALTLPAAKIEAILRLGEAKLARGQIYAARVLYERAARANWAAAATIVGKTYDPIFLAAIRATTVRADPSRAALWYQRAIDLGDQEGQERLARLRSRTSQMAGNE